MYHCRIQLYLVGRQRELFQPLREAPPLERFTHAFLESAAPDPALAARADVIFADLTGPDASQALSILSAGKGELVVLADRAALDGRVFSAASDVWPLPMGPEELADKPGEKKNYREQFLYATDARILLEPSIVRKLAATASDGELQELEDSLTGKGKGKDFHWVIIEAAHNPVLTQWFEQLEGMEAEPSIRTLVPPVKQKSVSAQIAQQHKNICEALKARDGEFAYFYMKEHLKFIKGIYEEYFDVFY